MFFFFKVQQIKTNQTGNGGHEGIFLFIANFEKIKKIIEAKSGARPRRQKREKISNHRKVEAELKLQLEEKKICSASKLKINFLTGGVRGGEMSARESRRSSFEVDASN